MISSFFKPHIPYFAPKHFYILLCEWLAWVKLANKHYVIILLNYRPINYCLMNDCLVYSVHRQVDNRLLCCKTRNLSVGMCKCRSTTSSNTVPPIRLILAGHFHASARCSRTPRSGSPPLWSFSLRSSVHPACIACAVLLEFPAFAVVEFEAFEVCINCFNC